jgi:hypothetical protein
MGILPSPLFHIGIVVVPPLMADKHINDGLVHLAPSIAGAFYHDTPVCVLATTSREDDAA